MPLLGGGTVSGVAGATATILLTTLDDCVWLVPFVVQAPSRRVAGEHATVFAITLVGLTAAVCGLTVVLQKGVAAAGTHKNNNNNTNRIDFDLLWSCVGAALCWSLAAYFYYRAWQKKQRRQREAAERLRSDEEGLLAAPSGSYGTAGGTQKEGAAVASHVTPVPSSLDHEPQPADVAQPLAVMSLTVMGALDEVSYFPALIVGQVFSLAEILLGCVLAVLIMLFVVVQCLAQCRPLLDLLDRVPLYAVVSAFATLLTAEVLWDLFSKDE
jgi:hypothetical protein